MQGRKLAAAAALGMLVFSMTAEAATGPRIGPKHSWTEMQKYEYYIGQLVAALNICRSFELSTQLKALADLSPYGQQGWKSLRQFDGVRGGHCGGYAEAARDVLEDADKIRNYLSDQYDCPQGQCLPEAGNASSDAPCRAEAEALLASMPVAPSDVKSIQMFARSIGVTNLVTGTDGHDARVRLNSCSGWLIIQLTPGCHLRQAYTRGDCTIDGVSRY